MIVITKLDGTTEPFDEHKLRRSLSRAKAKKEVVEEIVGKIEKGLRNGMSTSEIYRKAFLLLNKKEAKPVAARYSLRRAVMALGPSGFPFEKFIAELLKTQNFETETDVVLKGACAEHEIDVLAWNKEKFVIIEAKFHNELTVKSDLKVALYVKARLDDLRKTDFDSRKPAHLKDEGWLVTNTKFTHHALKYAQCAGLTLLGWNYPSEMSLEHMIEEAGLHPLTCLTTLSDREKTELLSKGIVLCRAVATDRNILHSMGFKEQKINDILGEVEMLCPIG